MDRTRRNGWIIVGVCAVLLAASVVVMAARISTFNRELSTRFAQFRFDVSLARRFTAFGRPVELTDATHDGAPSLRVAYADTVRDVPVKGPPAPDLPNLGAAYNEWVKVLEIHEVEWHAPPGGGERAPVDKPGTERVVLVSRRTPEGHDPATWGSVFRDNWTFDFYQFQPDGSIGHETYRWPRSRMGEESLARQARDGDKPAAALLTIPPLEERTWQYQAALHVIPKLSVPKHRFENDAFSPRVLGWTLPVSMLSGLAGVIGLFMAMAPRRRNAPSPAAPR